MPADFFEAPDYGKVAYRALLSVGLGEKQAKAWAPLLAKRLTKAFEEGFLKGTMSKNGPQIAKVLREVADTLDPPPRPGTPEAA